MPPTELLSIRAYAKHRGVSEGAVRKALQKGKITAEEGGQIDPDRADRDWDASTRAPVRTSAPSTHSDGTHTTGTHPGTQFTRRAFEREVAAAADSTETQAEADRRKAVALANIREREDAEGAGRVVDRQAVVHAWFGVCRTTRDQMLGLRERVEVRLGLSTEQLDVVSAELRAVLNEMTKAVPGLADPLPEAVDL